jgi:hypothetical protein
VGRLRDVLANDHTFGVYDRRAMRDELIIVGLGGSMAKEFAVRAVRGWAVPYVVPVAGAARVFVDGQVLDETFAMQLTTLEGETVRIAEKFASDHSLHRQDGCAKAAERVASAAGTPIGEG